LFEPPFQFFAVASYHAFSPGYMTGAGRLARPIKAFRDALERELQALIRGRQRDATSANQSTNAQLSCDEVRLSKAWMSYHNR
jgi:hypothetical protein